MMWMTLGNCAGVFNAWHALAPDEQKMICWAGREGEGRCPVMGNCYEYATTTYETWAFGTWGGLKEADRKALGFFGETLPPHPGRACAPPSLARSGAQNVTVEMPRRAK